MIIEFYPAKKVEEKVGKLELPWVRPHAAYTSFEIEGARRRNITPLEFRRRDEIVRKEFQNCAFGIGDQVYPHSKELYEKDGACRVRGIISSYSMFPTDEKWPENDKPFIVHAVYLSDKANTFNCTNNYLQKEVPLK